MRTPPLSADFIHIRACKPKCEKLLTLPRESNQVESYKEEKIIANQEIDISACMLYYKTQGR